MATHTPAGAARKTFRASRNSALRHGRLVPDAQT
jgi:hypothetical protein